MYDSDVTVVSETELDVVQAALYNSLVALVSAIELDVAQAVNRESDDADDSANVLVDISTSETVSEVDTLDSDILADVLYDAE